ncbi:MAG: transposase [Kiritimatiellia bacterium]
MPKTKRALNPDNGIGFYHVINRTVGREFLFQEEEKEEFTRLLRKAAAYSGIEIVTHVVMSNHYHALIEVPARRELSEPEILARVQAQVGAERYTAICREVARLRKMGGEVGERAVAKRLAEITKRMYTLSGFMHTLNQSMSEWYNRKYRRIGPLWAGRFKSLIVEGCGHALLAVAAYIDLNPVRAGIVKDPKDYRWSGYGEAVAGKMPARAGLTRLMMMEGAARNWGEAAPVYRRLVFATGVETGTRQGISREQVAEVLAKGGELTMFELLHCKVRYLTDGVAIGSRAFLDEVFAGNRGLFGKRRSNGPRPMKGGAAWAGLMTLRALRREPIT